MRPILFIPDCHIPYHDKRAWKCMLDAARKLKPETIVILGDFLDVYGLSSHTQTPGRARFHDEVAAGIEALDELDSLGASTKVYIEGNHEHRLSRYVKQTAPGLYGVTNLPDLLDLKKRGWRWVDYLDHYRVAKDFYATHDVGHAGKYALFQTQAAYGVSVVIGHTHRMGSVYLRTVDGTVHRAHSFGWLGDREAYKEYMPKVKARDWVLGFGVGWNDNGKVTVYPVTIENGRCRLPLELEKSS